MSKGIYQRGYLPHWDLGGSLQAITFRLADSVPATVIQQWKDELACAEDDAEVHQELHRRIAHYEDAGHGACYLRHPECASIIQDELISGHHDNYRLLEWCIMPNHIHVLIKLHPDAVLSDVIRSWKGRSSIAINRQLNRSGSLWQREYYDRLIRDADHYDNCVAYIRNNPARAKLCATTTDWPFSSAGVRWIP